MRSVALVVVLLIVAACSPGAPTGTGPGNSSATGPPGSGPSLPTQTDTDWGRIWDALPPSFPTPPSGTPATDMGDGPKSAQLVVALERDVVVAFYRDALRDLGYSVGSDGPLEDGSVTVTASDGYRCRMGVSVRATGQATAQGESMVSILFGAGCPFA